METLNVLPDTNEDTVLKFWIEEVNKAHNWYKEAEIATIRKFMVPLDIILLTPEELNSKSSLIAGYARAGQILHAA